MIGLWTYLVIAVSVILLVCRLLQRSIPKEITKLFDGLPEISPHWFWGNTDANEHYEAMKGLRMGVFYSGRKRKLFILDPDIINKVTVTDFNHFVDSGFLDVEYSKVLLEVTNNTLMYRSFK